MIRPALLVVLLLGLVHPAAAQTVAVFEVQPAADAASGAYPVSIVLDGVTSISSDSLELVQVENGRRSKIPHQIRAGTLRTLHWIVEGFDTAARFELVRTTRVAADEESARVRSVAADGSLQVISGGQPLLGYRFETLAAPDTVDSAYARSGFIHPLRTPAGHVLTRIQPDDHYHHYGIWNPWTQTEYEGQIVDFWNLAKREGKVRFAGFASVSEGPVFAEYEAHHEHVVTREDGEEVALNELQTVRVYRPDGDRYLVDLTSTLSCAGDSPIRLLEYRYGGLGWRGPVGWTDDNSEMLTSDGRTRADADGSTARWIRIQGAVDDEKVGLVLMSHPTNYNHPEPLRVWPPDSNDHGDVFVNFSPTKTTDWLLEPGTRYALRYRFIVFDGEIAAQEVDDAWHAFARPPRISILEP